MPLISILVPVYKVEDYLRECVDSILAQTFRDFELVLVDDGSPDACPAICDEYAKADERIRVVHKENGGLVSARKTGISVASGEYVTFVDSDDKILPSHLQSFASAILKTGADIVVGNVCQFSQTERLEHYQHIAPGFYDKEKMIAEVYPRMLSANPYFTFGIMPSVCIKCIRRSLAQSCLLSIPETVEMGEDAALSYPCLLDATSLCILRENTYMYRSNPNSITHVYNPSRTAHICALLSYLSEAFSARSFDPGKQLAAYTCMLQRLAISNENVSKDKKKRRENLSLWASTPVVKEALSKTGLPRLPLHIRMDRFAIRHRLFFLLPLSTFSLRIERRLTRMRSRRG